MTLTLLIAFSILVAGWSFLTLLGNERQRLVQDHDAAAKREAAAAAAAAATAAKAASEAPVGR